MSNQHLITLKAVAEMPKDLKGLQSAAKALGGKAGSSVASEMFKQRQAAASVRERARGGSNKLEPMNKLESAIFKLNKSIERFISKNNSSGGGSHDGGNSSGSSKSKFSKAGAVLGGAAGVAIAKLNQIGNAYIDYTSAQKGTAGLAEFRGTDNFFGGYSGGEMAQAMRQYAIATGNFARNQTVDGHKIALKYGNVFGLSASDVLGQAGTFTRAGGNYEKAVTQAFGGLDNQVDTMKFMQAFAGVLEEAVASGFDASKIAKNWGTDVLSLTKATENKNVTAITNALKSMGSVKNTAATGQIGNQVDVYMRRGAENALLETLKDENQLATLVSQGYISETDKEYFKDKEGLTTADVVGRLKPSAYHELVDRGIKTASDTTVTQWVATGYQKDGYDVNEAARNLKGLGLSDLAPLLRSAYQSQVLFDTSYKGKAELAQEYDRTDKSGVFFGNKREQTRTARNLRVGASAADVSFRLEEALGNIAMSLNESGALDTAVAGVKLLAEGIDTLGNVVGDVTNGIKASVTVVKEVLKTGSIQRGVEKYAEIAQ